ncbi:MAG: hypothetical protein NVS4B10_15520 [Myxococcales bacterium]
MTGRTTSAQRAWPRERVTRSAPAQRDAPAARGAAGLRCAFRREGGALRMRWAPAAHAFAILVLAMPVAAQARIYTQVRPRVAIGALYDDNVRFDGTGGDALGEAVPGLKLNFFGAHQLRLGFDCQASIARLARPERFGNPGGGYANGGVCEIGLRDQLAQHLRMVWTSRTTYARDPFAISSLGLLLRRGQTQVFQSRVTGLFTQAVSTRGAMQYGIYANILNFGSNDPGNGYQIAPQIGYAHRTSERNTVDVAVREQIFLGAGATAVPGLHGAADSGLLAQGTSALVGFSRRLTSTFTGTLRGGPLLLTRPNASTVLFPVARLEVFSDTPTTGVHFVAAHDLALGPSQAGALVGDIAEIGFLRALNRQLGSHLRAGIYRNAAVGSKDLGLVGYSTEAGLDYRFAREWSLGLAALRDARLTSGGDGLNVDRDVFQMRLTWEKARD